MRDCVKFLLKCYYFVACFNDKFHTIPHELSPSCNCTGLCNQKSIKLNEYTALWDRMGVAALKYKLQDFSAPEQ